MKNTTEQPLTPTSRPNDGLGQHQVATSLLELPPELWSKIGRLAIDVSPKPCINPWYSLGANKTLDKEADDHEITLVTQPAITRTCRVLREELLSYIYHQHLTLCLIDTHLDIVWTFFNRWLNAIGHANHSALQSIWMGFEFPEDEPGWADKMRMWNVDVQVGDAQAWPAESVSWFLYHGVLDSQRIRRITFH